MCLNLGRQNHEDIETGREIQMSMWVMWSFLVLTHKIRVEDLELMDKDWEIITLLVVDWVEIEFVFDDKSRYTKLVGKISVLNYYRPDISFSCPQTEATILQTSQVHYYAAITILQYFRNNLAKGLLYSASSGLLFLWFCRF
jgi:hypothetical protein